VNFNPTPLLQKLNTLRGECSALRERISQVNAMAAQLNDWAGIMKGILAEKDLRARLHARLDEVLREWNSPAVRSSTANESNAVGGSEIRPKALWPANRPSLPAKVPEEAPEGQVITPSLPADQINRTMVAPPTPPLVGTSMASPYPTYVQPVQQLYSHPVVYPQPYGAPVVYVTCQRPIYRVIPPLPVYYARSRFYR
jgi:hypothetical protein